MPISSTQRKFGPTPGNGVAKDFPFTCKVFDTTDIQVILTAADGGDTVLALGSDFSVTLNANQDAQPGGTVSLKTALASGRFLTLLSDVPNTQPTDWQNQGGFSPDTLDESLDRGVAQTQQLAEEMSRALVVPVTSGPITMAKPEGGSYLGWDSEGKRVINVAPQGAAAYAAYSTARSDSFVGDGVSKVFALSDDPGSVHNLFVSIGGVNQSPVSDFIWNGGASLEFVAAPPAGAKISAQFFRTAQVPGDFAAGVAAAQAAAQAAANSANAASIALQNAYGPAHVVTSPDTLLADASSYPTIVVNTDLRPGGGDVIAEPNNLVPFKDVQVRGRGRTTPGLYDHEPIPEVSPPFCVDWSNVNVEQLRRVNRKDGLVVVVFAGDSTDTFAANSRSPANMLYTVMCRTIREMAPELKFRFINLSIGGTTMEDFNGVPARPDKPAWYTNPARPWLEYVKDFAPDWVITNFGMNTTNSPTTALREVDQKLKLWAIVPCLTVGLNFYPAPFDHPANPDWKTYDVAERHHQIAGAARSFCDREGIGYFDFHRAQRKAIHGKDPVLTIFDGGPAPHAGYDIPHDTVNRAFPFTDTMTNHVTRVKVKFGSVVGTSGLFSVKIGYGSSDVLYVSKEDASHFRVLAYSGTIVDYPTPPGVPYINEVLPFRTDANGVTELEFCKHTLNLTIRDKTDAVNYGEFEDFILDKAIITLGGRYQPAVLYTTEFATAMVGVNADYGRAVQNLPAMLTKDAWGDMVLGGPSIGRFNGSAFNHYGDFMAWLIRQVVRASRMFGAVRHTPVDFDFKGLYGARNALDFRRDLRRVNSAEVTPIAASAGFAFSRAGATSAVPLTTGGFQTFAADTQRRTKEGLMVELDATNLFLNSAAPATQTITLAAGSYALGVWGTTGSVTAAAGTAVGSGFGAAAAAATGGQRTLTITTGGTVSFTVTGAPTYVQVEAGVRASTPIVTAGAAATRSKDLPVLTLASNPDAAALLVEFTTNPVHDTTRSDVFVEWGDGTLNNRALIYLGLGGNPTLAATVNLNGTPGGTLATENWPTSQRTRALVRLKNGLMEFWVNGIKDEFQFAYTGPINWTTLRVGHDFNLAQHANAFIPLVVPFTDFVPTDVDCLRLTNLAENPPAA